MNRQVAPLDKPVTSGGAVVQQQVISGGTLTAATKNKKEEEGEKMGAACDMKESLMRPPLRTPRGQPTSDRQGQGSARPGSVVAAPATMPLAVPASMGGVAEDAKKVDHDHDHGAGAGGAVHSGSVASMLNARQKATMYDLFLALRAGNAAVLSLEVPVRALAREHHAFQAKDTPLALSALGVGVVVACLLADLLGRSTVLTGLGGASQSQFQSHQSGHLVEIAALSAGAAAVALFVATFTHRCFQKQRGAAAAARRPRFSGFSEFPGFPGLRGLRRLCLRLDQSSAAVRLANDCFVVFLTLFAGLAGVARALRGGCNDHYMLPYATSGSGSDSGPGFGSEDHNCNAAADVALETYTTCLLVVLLPQVFFKGASRTAICLAWAISVCLLNLSLHLAAATSPYAWIRTNVHFALLMLVSYELERRDLQRFLDNQLMRSAHAEQRRLAASTARHAAAVAQTLVDDGRRELDAKRSMVRHVSHEIRTPLNITAVGMDIVATELKKLADVVPPFLLETVESCQEACASSLEVLNDLLDFEKLAAGMFTVDRTPTALAPFLRGVAKLFLVSAQAKQVTVEMLGGERDLAVDIDFAKMKTVFRNLLSNAIKFSPVRGTITVDIAAHEATTLEEAHVVVSVKDSGAGMSAENLLQLFQEGVQFNANTLQGGGGSGFGLYISKGIVMLHKGKIWAESAGEGCGSTFFVKLPLLPPGSVAPKVDVPPTNQEQSAKDDKAADKTSPLLTILVVDDSDMTRKLLMRKLRSLGHTCMEADDGVQAVSMVVGSVVYSEDGASMASPRGSFLVDKGAHPKRASAIPSPGSSPRTITRVSQAQVASGPIDLVLMDSNMPRMGGLDATFEMRRWGYSGVIVAVSGDDNGAEFMRAGANAFLFKPLNPTSLAGIIDQHFAVAVTADGSGATYNRHGGRSIFRAPTRTQQTGSLKISSTRPAMPRPQPPMLSGAASPAAAPTSGSAPLSPVFSEPQIYNCFRSHSFSQPGLQMADLFQ